MVMCCDAFWNNSLIVCVFFCRANAKFLWKRIPAAIKNVSFWSVGRFSDNLDTAAREK